MKKLKEIYDNLKEKMGNPRIRATVILFMYAIFFILIFTMINIGRNMSSSINTSINTNNKQIDKDLNYTNIINSYKYISNIEVNFEDDISKYLIEGNQSSSEKNQSVELLNKETETYEVTVKPDFINDDFFDLENVVNYVNNMEYEFSTTYKNGSIMKSYLVPVKNINNSINSSEKIEINIYELDNNITKIIINSTNLDKLSNNKINNILYSIEYTYDK